MVNDPKSEQLLPKRASFCPKSEQFIYWLQEKPLEMRIVLDRFCKFACEF
jgi:hypothetical protein